MRWLILLCATAHADTTLPAARSGGWAQSCVARLETARSAAAKIDARIAAGKVDITVDEEVLPLVEHVRFFVELAHKGGGVWIKVEPTRNKKRVADWQLFAGSTVRRFRAINGRVAEVLVNVDDAVAQARLITLWQAAADDCLALTQP